MQSDLEVINKLDNHSKSVKENEVLSFTGWYPTKMGLWGFLEGDRLGNELNGI
jgi:hypothetical protein